MKRIAACAVLISYATFCSRALAADPIDLAKRFNYERVTYVIQADGTLVEQHETSQKILKESALEWTKRASVSYSTSAQKADVVSAYTQKADGRHIDVPKDNYQIEVNSGRGKDSPVYSDQTTMTVVFPDVSVGDSVVFSYRLTQTEPLFPGQVSVSEVFNTRTAYDEVSVRFDYPAALWVQFEARQMKLVRSESQGERRIIEWSYANPSPVKSEREDYSVYDPERDAGYGFSTFHDYAEIAAAYGKRALPKAQATERIKQLAADIVKDQADPKEQARLLYEWVAKNITYAGNCIGVGAVVPRDLPFVLDNKIGDCKDHATLLQALYSARGIEAKQALVNSGSTYRLPRIPVVSMVNHVINYLPGLDLYVDSTSNATPFGMLPFGDQDKPVLWVQGYRDGTKTPSAPNEANWQETKVAMKIGDDGSVAGTFEISQKGMMATGTRAWMRNMTKDSEKDLIKQMLGFAGLKGDGSIERDDPTALTDSYHYKVTMNAEKFIRFPGAGAFPVTSPISMGAGIQGTSRHHPDSEGEVESACASFKSVDNYRIELPARMKVLSVPDDFEGRTDQMTYRSTYKLQDGVFTARREIEGHYTSNVCPAQVMAQQWKMMDQVTDDLKQQVLYK